jgi:Protein of unknown function (DUF3102)
MIKIKRELGVIASDLRAALKNETNNIIAIGDLLIEAKAALKHGDWLGWLERRNFHLEGGRRKNT